MKILLIITSILFFTCSCSSYLDEKVKSGKSAAASSRINNSQANSDSVFKELDE